MSEAPSFRDINILPPLSVRDVLSPMWFRDNNVLLPMWFRDNNVLSPMWFRNNNVLSPRLFHDNDIVSPMPPLQDVSDFNNLVTRNVRNFMYPGLPGVDDEVDNFLRVMRDAPPVLGYGTRGASTAAKSAIEALETFEVGFSEEEEEERVCVVCKDVMVMGEIVKKLPCGHYYHENCILPWLRRRNSCPLCRFQLQTDNV